MREYAKKQAGKNKCYHIMRQDHGQNSQQWKLHEVAFVPEGARTATGVYSVPATQVKHVECE